MKETVEVLLSKEMSPSQMERHLQAKLRSLDDVGQKCLDLANDTHDHFKKVGMVLQVTQELVVARLAGTQKAHEKAKQDRKLQEVRIKAHEAAKKKSKEEFESLEKKLKEAQTSMKEAMASKPSMGDMIGAGFADAACGLIKSMGPALTQAGMAYMTGGTSVMMAQANGAVAGLGGMGAMGAGGARGLGAGVAPMVASGAAAAVEDPVQKSNVAAAGAVDLLHNLVQGVTSQVGQKVT